MTLGPGKYDPLCTMVRNISNAHVAMVLILGGEHGQGFSVQMDPRRGMLSKKDVARLLRDVASDIEREGDA